MSTSKTKEPTRAAKSARGGRAKQPAKGRRFTQAQKIHALTLIVAGMKREQVAQTVGTSFAADGDTKGWFAWGVALARPFMITPAKGARTSLHVATSDDAGETSGLYWKSRKRVYPTRVAQDDAAAKRLWDESERLLGLTNGQAARVAALTLP